MRCVRLVLVPVSSLVSYGSRLAPVLVKGTPFQNFLSVTGQEKNKEHLSLGNEAHFGRQLSGTTAKRGWYMYLCTDVLRA